MADFYAGFSVLSQYRAHCQILETAVDTAGNASTVTGYEWVEKLSGSGYSTGNSGNGGGIYGDISVGGGGWAPYSFTGGTTSKLIAAGSGVVGHNVDGTRTASGSYDANDNNGGNMGYASGSWALGLTPIARGAIDRYNGSAYPEQLLERYDTPTASWKLQVLERYNGTAWVREI